MSRRVSYDELAVELLLAGELPGSPAFKRLADHANDRFECPVCEVVDVAETNDGDTVCCPHCGCHFEPPSVVEFVA